MAESLHFSKPYLLTSIRHLRTFGCVAYVHLKGHRAPDKSRKMDPRAEKGFFVGTEGFHGHVYLVWLPQSHRFVRARDVRFNEAQIGDENDDFDDIHHVVELVDPTFEELGSTPYRLPPVNSTGVEENPTPALGPTPSVTFEEPCHRDETPVPRQQPTPDPTPGQDT